MKKSTLIYIIVLAAIVVPVLAIYLARSSKKQEAAAAKKVCRLAYTAKGYYSPLFLAAQKGYYDSDKVQIEEVKLGLSSGIAAAEALVSGAADIAAMGDVPTLICLESKLDVVILPAFSGGERMHSLVTRKDSGISKPEDLKGKKLGVQFGSSTHGGVYLYLQKHNIDPSELTLVNMPQKDLVEALASGAIDVLAASAPTPTLALNKVKGAVLLTELTGLGNNYPLLFIASRKFAENNPEALEVILKGTAKAIAEIKSDFKTAAKETAAVTGAPVELEESVFNKMVWEVRLTDEEINSLQTTAEFLHQLGKLKRVPDVRAHIYKPEK